STPLPPAAPIFFPTKPCATMARKTSRPIRPNPLIATLTAISFLSPGSIKTDNQALHVNAEASTVNENSGALDNRGHILTVPPTGGWKAARTRTLESVRYVAQPFQAAGSGSFPAPQRAPACGGPWWYFPDAPYPAGRRNKGLTSCTTDETAHRL